MNYLNKYNDDEERQKRMSQEDPYVMYLIVHSTLGMGAGKIAAQCGHAVGMLYIKRDELIQEHQKKESPEIKHKLELWNAWQQNSFRKIVLSANDNKWVRVKEKLVDAVLVVDSGLTEIPYGSETVIGVWPMLRSQAPQTIRKLQTLK